VCANLLDDSVAKTQQGRRTIAKTLTSLGAATAERLNSLPEMEGSGISDKVSEVVEEMTDALNVESLVAEYTKKLRAIEATQQRVLKFMKARAVEKPEAADALREKLIDSGLTDDDWKELVQKSRPAAGGPAAGDSTGATGTGGGLGPAVAKLNDLLDPSRHTQDDPSIDNDLVRLLSDVNREIANTAERTEQTIRALAQELSQTTPPPGKADTDSNQPTLSRKNLMALLGELGQELCQPLSVLQSVVQMLKTKRLGEINEKQDRMLAIGCESADRLKTLVDKLILISNVPKDLSPNEKILGKIYDQAPA
jgi:hypothetical protein